MGRKPNLSTVLIAMVLLMAVVIGGVGYLVLKPAPGSGGGGSGQPLTPSEDCGYKPEITIYGLDAIKTSTAATPTTVNYFVNGVYMGTAAPAIKKGDTWRIIGDLAAYLADEQSLLIGCGLQAITAHPYGYANATITLKDDPVSSSNTLTQGGGAYNATLVPSGGVRNIGIIIQGTTQKSSGNLLLVFEGPASSASKVSGVSLTCNGAVMPTAVIPNGVAASGAASTRAAWTISAVIGAESKACNLQIQDVAGQTLSGIVYMKWYAMQKAVLADGTVAEGAYDSTPNGANAAIYQDLYTSNFYINP